MSATATLAAPAATDTARLLIIDDEPSIRESLETLLTLEGFDVTLAPDGVKGIDILSRDEFDLLLLDVKVGGHLGQMILETLRRHDLLLDTAVILVADRRDASVEDVAEAIGAVHIHEKRAPYEDLLPALYALLDT